MFGNQPNRPMKRAFSPEFDSSPRGGFRGQPFNKRHRGDTYNQPQTLEEKISRLGDTGFRNNDIGHLAREIDQELANKEEEQDKIKMIVSKISQCIISFPTRNATYATLVGLISVKHYDISSQIINALHNSYPSYFEAQKWREALIIIHQLACLVNCKLITPSAIISHLEQLLEKAQEENIPQTRSDYFVFTVLTSLPIVALELASQAEHDNFDQILNTIETILTNRSTDHINDLRVWSTSDSTIQMDYLDSLWVQTKNFRANGWNEKFLHRPYNDKEYKDLMASSLIPQASPTIQIPSHDEKYNYPRPTIVFRIFEDDVAEGHRTIPGSDKIERFCIEEHIRQIIDENSSNTRDCARHLGYLYRCDQLPLKHILIETVLGELFNLPEPRHPIVLYETLLYEFKKIFHLSNNPDEVKFNYENILYEAVGILYENLDTMNVACMMRFINWFSFQLNNVDFVYPWQTWQDATTKELDSPKTIFVQAILDHCIRFCFHVRINTLVSASLSNLVPPKPSVEYKPTFGVDPKSESLAATIKQLIVEKADAKKISETLNIRIDGAQLSDDFQLHDAKHSDKLLKIDIFSAVIFSLASKSLTHLSSAIGKFKNVFKALTDQVEGGQVQLLQTMHSCMLTHPHLQTILIDKLLKAGMIENNEVVNWILSDSMRKNHMKPYIWDIMAKTSDAARAQFARLRMGSHGLDLTPCRPSVKSE